MIEFADITLDGFGSSLVSSFFISYNAYLDAWNMSSITKKGQGQFKFN